MAHLELDKDDFGHMVASELRNGRSIWLQVFLPGDSLSTKSEHLDSLLLLVQEDEDGLPTSWVELAYTMTTVALWGGIFKPEDQKTIIKLPDADYRYV